MVETSLSVRLEQPNITGEEIQRMAVGILIRHGFLREQEWPEHAVFIDIVPNLNDPCLPEFVVRMCESEEEEMEVEKLKQLMGKDDYGVKDDGLHFEMRKHTA